jgi:D-erythronate 2-dehydrogenase
MERKRLSASCCWPITRGAEYSTGSASACTISASRAPNKAASGLVSNILRERLVGREAILPVGEDVRMWHATWRSAVSFVLHAATIDLTAFGGRRSLMMPGVSVTVSEQITALRRVAGEAAVQLIRPVFDPVINAMFATIPGRFDTRRAVTLGFQAETTF